MRVNDGRRCDRLTQSQSAHLHGVQWLSWNLSFGKKWREKQIVMRWARSVSELLYLESGRCRVDRWQSEPALCCSCRLITPGSTWAFNGDNWSLLLILIAVVLWAIQFKLLIRSLHDARWTSSHEHTSYHYYNYALCDKTWHRQGIYCGSTAVW